VNALNQQGKTILISTHNMRDLLELTRRVLVLHQGRLVFDGSVPDLFKQQELASWGMDIPLEIRVGEILRGHGWQIPPDAVSWQEIIFWLKRDAQEGSDAVL